MSLLELRDRFETRCTAPNSMAYEHGGDDESKLDFNIG